MQTHTVARIKTEPSQMMMMEESQLSISQLSPPQVVEEPGEGVATTVVKPEPTPDEFTGTCMYMYMYVYPIVCMYMYISLSGCALMVAISFSAANVSTIDMLRREIQQLKCQLAASGLVPISEIRETSTGIYM